MTFLTGQLIARKKKKTTLFYREEQCRVSHLTIYSSEAFILAILLLVIQIANTHTHTHTLALCSGHCSPFFAYFKSCSSHNNPMSRYYSIPLFPRCTIFFHTLASLKSKHSQWHLSITVNQAAVLVAVCGKPSSDTL